MTIESVTKSELLSFLENEAKFRIDSYIENAIQQAEETITSLIESSNADEKQLAILILVGRLVSQFWQALMRSEQFLAPL